MNAIEIKKVKKSYSKNKLVLKGINLNIMKGRIFGLVGPNGAGKSTIINIIAGLFSIDEGKIKIFDKEISWGDYEYKKNIGFVLEKPFYIEKLTGYEFLEFISNIFQLSNESANSRIIELLEILHLKQSQNEFIDKYSVGMKKKISLAAALIHSPKLIILDEPFESLDPVSVKTIKNILKATSINGATIFISSHLMDLVENLCDEIAIINNGELIFQSDIKHIRKKIKNEITQEVYQSLEEIFIDLTVTDKEKTFKELSWF